MRGKRLQGIHWWVRKWADLRGAAPAVTCDGTVVTWSELDRRVDVLANHLDFLGVGAGDRVGCLMPNCIEFVVALHAASRIGAIFVPLNIRYTVVELGFAVRHAGLAALAVDESFAGIVADAGLPLGTAIVPSTARSLRRPAICRLTNGVTDAHRDLPAA